MNVIELFLRPAFTMYIGVIISLMVIPLLYKREMKLSALTIPFLLLSILIAFLAINYQDERRAILIATSALFAMFPLVKYSDIFVSITSAIRMDTDPRVIFKIIVEKLFSMEWDSKCVNENEFKLRVQSRTSNIIVSFEDDRIFVEGKASQLVSNIISITSLVAIGYGAYIYLSKIEEIDIARLATTLAVISFLAIIVLAVIFNGIGFVEAKTREVTITLMKTINDFKKSLEFAQAVEIAKKIREKKSEGETS